MFISNIDIFNNAEQCVLVVLLYYSFINECQCKVSLVCFFFFFLGKCNMTAENDMALTTLSNSYQHDEMKMICNNVHMNCFVYLLNIYKRGNEDESNVTKIPSWVRVSIVNEHRTGININNFLIRLQMSNH